ncbi:hypothetical protein TKK_0001994 [Trichogramma kaykai]
MWGVHNVNWANVNWTNWLDNMNWADWVDHVNWTYVDWTNSEEAVSVLNVIFSYVSMNKLLFYENNYR